eukprot:jgi/Psemu1/16521/gm1.16521_g
MAITCYISEHHTVSTIPSEIFHFNRSEHFVPVDINDTRVGSIFIRSHLIDSHYVQSAPTGVCIGYLHDA